MNYAGHHVISAVTPTTTMSPIAIGFLWTDTSGGTPALKVCSSISPVTFVSVGGGAVADSDVVFSDITTGNADNTKHGYMPKLPWTLDAGTVAVSSPFSLKQTWNDGGGGAVAFTGLLIDLVSTSSNGSSMPLQIKVGGASIFQVQRDGRLVGNSTAFFNSDVRGGTFSCGASGYSTFSDGVDFNAGFLREGAGMRTSLGASGYGRHNAESFKWVPNGASKPAAAAGVRGLVWYTPGGAGVADTFEVCRKDAADAYAWVTLF